MFFAKASASNVLTRKGDLGACSHTSRMTDTASVTIMIKKSYYRLQINR